MNAGRAEPPAAGFRIEIWISTLLRVGVTASLALVVLGTLLCFVAHPEYRGGNGDFAALVGPGAQFPHTLLAVARGVLRLEGPAWVMLGLLLLIATPVMRVAVSIFLFAAQKDRTYTIVTSIVLALLLASFFLGG